MKPGYSFKYSFLLVYKLLLGPAICIQPKQYREGNQMELKFSLRNLAILYKMFHKNFQKIQSNKVFSVKVVSSN